MKIEIKDASSHAAENHNTPTAAVEEPEEREKTQGDQPKNDEHTAANTAVSGGMNEFLAKLQQLEELGFTDRRRNTELLVRHQSGILAAVRELLGDV